MSASDAEQAIAEFRSSWEAFSTTGTPGAGAAFAIVDALSGDLFGYWLDPVRADVVARREQRHS